MKKMLVPFVITLVIGSLMSLGLYQLSENRLSDINSSGAQSSRQILGAIERVWYDARFKIKKAERAKNVMVAKIDDASLERFGRWPWSRRVYADIIDLLFERGASAVAFDAVFSEPEFQSAYLSDALKATTAGREQSLKDELKLDDTAISTISEVLPSVGDQIFGGSVKQHPNTVLGYFWQGADSCKIYDPTNPEHVKEHGQLDRQKAAILGYVHVDSLVDALGVLSNRAFLINNLEPFDGTTHKTKMWLGFCPLVNRSAIAAYSQHQGFFNATADADGLFRRAQLFMPLKSDIVPESNRDFLPSEWFKHATIFPSLALEALRAHFGPDTKYNLHFEKEADVSILKGFDIEAPGKNKVFIPTLPDGTMMLNFYGSQSLRTKPIAEFSLGNIDGEIFKSEFQQEFGLDKEKPLKNQIVLIGPTALGVYDLRPTPAQSDGAGVFIHAAMVGRLLSFVNGESPNVQIQWAPLWLSLTILWLLAGLLGMYLAKARVLTSIAATLLAIGLLFAVDLYLFFYHWISLDSMSIFQSLLAVFTSLFVYKYFTEEKERTFVKGAFSRYVSPDVVDSIIEDPKKLNLGGQRQHLSVLFSDVRGFTTISEKMTAAELGKFMNDYLSPMTDVILAERGTIDKYMGDAIMAIFGAPLTYQGHAQAAAIAGLKMLEKLEELKKEWAAKNLPNIDIGIGINTGEMSVGNMGSTRIFSYTVMGDSVNLGSRLEGITKEYGVRFIVSEFTKKELDDSFVARELDRVKVKGKLEPVTIFEVKARGDHGDIRKKFKEFESALHLYYQKQFQEAHKKFESMAEFDECSKIYLRRCELWQESPPPENWDGSWTMKTK